MVLNARPYWYLRHGETDWNAAGLSQGRTDVPLNDKGLEQARSAGGILAGHWHDYAPIARVVSSPLGRALRTAEIARDAITAAGGPALDITTDPGLAEVCFGEQEGQPMGDWYDAWIAGEFCPSGAEPFADLRDRAVAAVNRATHGEGVPLIVCHGAMFRALRSAMGLAANVRLPNAVPLFLTPGEPWALTQVG
ncbi:phosphoglycerate mutase [Ameyamaea chiangmaiensis NBRC 103196]|uniref:Histidine phosphatase family protein n=1 Tax=Ameyamaea chiangmaiensis TaxID=442969 RepID=A0A850PAV5_9PROT|nr:histidine phosphatase family protein [Ameyamaea chiangmaiensis]MBS4074982.1 histidine phosphatase family protein [Ameyamaea chiangmaiensis]NVN41657.1 histidine phosphatase family protein [Ameyamaea chiangmaiensis]GBQ65980.1 phosphoglycerate mutase [Ameyamaea chiangmaiensis NBRC 103196]